MIGSGGREHAVVWALRRSAKDPEVFCANGNSGIAEIATCVNMSPTDIRGLANFAVREKIDMTFVGGETSLALGITDEFQKIGLRIVGATKKEAKLESSKAFAKDFMKRHRIPTAEYENVSSISDAIKILEGGKFGDENSPVVVKADGLASGKGVFIAADRAEAIGVVNAMLSGELVDSNAAKKIVLEEFLVGKEISLLLFADGKNFVLMPPVRDHKRIGEGDTGANTGGMGTITDSSLLSPNEKEKIIDDIIRPTLEGAKKEGFPFKGILFLGLMMTSSGAKVLEYNVRLGDPEAQAILINLETDFVDICNAIIDQTLNKIDLSWRSSSSACIILAAKNYPRMPKKGDSIKGLESAKLYPDTEIFHAGTSLDEEGNFITSGGRVLAVTARANSLSTAIHRAYKAVNEISWSGMQYRQDIGKDKNRRGSDLA